MTETRKFRADIQGLRAVAVLAVLIFHASSGRWLPGGFVGVDVFFVISGFLITGILLGSEDGNRPSLAAFYARRVRRLLPALCGMLVFVLAAGALLLPAADYAAAARMAAATLLFSSNMMLLDAPSYFDLSGELKPLQHTWSLGVEEQFYLLFPIALAGILRFAQGHKVLLISLGAIASLALSALMLDGHPTWAFYSLPTRAFELLIGALLALHLDVLGRIGGRSRDLLSCAGLVTIGASFIFLGAETPFPGLTALIPCLGTAAVIAAGIPATSAGGRLVSGPPFLFLGAISYSLYLWHWPLLVFARHWVLGPLDLVTAGLVVLASVLLAWMSWRWIEQPVLRRGEARWVIPALMAVAASVLTVSIGAVLGQGLPQRFPAEARAMFAARDDYNPRRDACLSHKLKEIPYEAACVFGEAPAPSVALWADSQGAELVVALGQALSGRQASVLQLTASACPPAVNYVRAGLAYCTPHNTRTLERLVQDSRISHVVLVARYERHSATSAALIAGLTSSIVALESAGKQVILIGPLPSHRFDPPHAIGMLFSQGRDPVRWGMAGDLYRKENAAFIEALPALAVRTGATYVDPFPILCRQDHCPAWRPETGVLYFNDSHLSVSGARLLVPSVLEQITAAHPPVIRSPVAS